jgi:multidrug efflux pump subunit AcrA (membrane-fusion protein)
MPLPPGRTVDVTIVIAVRDNALLVPRGAIIDAGKDPRIYVINANGRVDERQVKLDPWPSLDVIIADGAGPGDVIVLTPALTHVSARVRARETISLTSDPEN